MTNTQFSNDDDLALILKAAKNAATIAMGYFRKSPDVILKADASPVTAADMAIDAYLHDQLRAARPHYGWLSEERDDDGSRHEHQRSFVVDPIDGTRAFIGETEEWCISIGLIENGRPVVGVLYCPVTGSVYHSIKGKGAYHNQTRLPLRSTYSSNLRIAGPKPMIRALQDKTNWPIKAMPYVPSLALRLAMVAEGGLDATLVKPNSAFWDIAAADLLVNESNCRLLDLTGNDVDYGMRSPRLGAMISAPASETETILAVVRTLSIG